MIPIRIAARIYFIVALILVAASGAYSQSGLSNQLMSDIDVTNEPAVIRVVLDDNYPPFVFRDQSGILQGILVDQWKLWESKTGIPVELAAMNWADALDAMKAGTYDVIDTIFFSESRQLLFDFGDPYQRIDVPLFFDADISGIRGASDLKGFIVGVKSGDNVVEILKKAGIESLLFFDSYESIVQAAADGKLKVFTVDRPSALYHLAKYGILDRFRETKPLYSGQLHRAVRKGDHATMALIRRGFASITTSEYDQINRQWLGFPLQDIMPLRIILLAGIIAAIVVSLFLLWVLSLRSMVKRRTKELEQSREFFKSVFDSVSEVISIHNRTGRCLDINARNFELSGYTKEELLSGSIGAISHTSAGFTQELAERSFELVAQNGPSTLDWAITRKDGRTIPVEVNIRTVHIGTDDLFLVTARDVTERKQAEEAIKNALTDREAALMEKQAALEEKQALLMELQHRVKNNLALISSLLNLELGRITDESARIALLDLKSRVASLASLYTMLHDSGNISTVRLDEYLERVADMVTRSYRRAGIELTTRLSETVADARRAAVAGLVLNELLTNAYKYAFPDGRSGTIAIALEHRDGTIALEVSDDGIGFDAASVPSGKIGFGIELVNMMAAQLNGSVHTVSQGGTTFRVEFPS